MKNIHILPTDKPSRLWINNLLQGKLELSKEAVKGSNTAQHIYITSDEEIKEGDWYYWTVTNSVQKAKKDNLERLPKISDGSHKIILTTDQDLIKDGVQAIDDEFLEWFVKNPSCESVEVYEVGGKLFAEPITPQEEPKQKTLEEVAENYANQNTENDEFHKLYVAFNDGAKWQAERMYSEEDMISFAKFFTQYTFIDNTLVGDLYALDETGNHPAYKIAELISIWKKK